MTTVFSLANYEFSDTSLEPANLKDRIKAKVV